MLAGTLKDGFGITVTFGVGESTVDHSDIMLKIDPSSLTPPAVDGGDAIDTVSHSNSDYRTKHPKVLQDIADGSCTVYYDPSVWAKIIAAINDNVLLTFTFPNGDTLEFFGYLKSFTPNELVEGEQPTAECVFVATNYDHEAEEESGPELTAGS